jgi:hypothetical protein
VTTGHPGGVQWWADWNVQTVLAGFTSLFALQRGGSDDAFLYVAVSDLMSGRVPALARSGNRMYSPEQCSSSLEQQASVAESLYVSSQQEYSSQHSPSLTS